MMRGQRGLALVACSVAMMFASSVARAGGNVTTEHEAAKGGSFAGGTITFVGALVEPTCNISTAPDLVSAVTRAAQARQRYQQSCSGSSATPDNVSRTYSASVVHLSSAEPDQVLNYFANYVRAAQPSGADPVLVTQTYE
ncbi:MAG TPA: hypothetical protein VME63_05980 [Dyella sp.]|uniref:hypothetical protein n=1 Tax=Dyella sp. TaxID=1869338 RepID=UPI002C918DEC|nr:hypothetical protein [Dyella sp.]HTV84931.1 hypothetical protein [Dyella sp.]